MKVIKEEANIDSTKREFMKKFGSYAATAPIGMYMLMTPDASAKVCSGTNGGSMHDHMHNMHDHMHNMHDHMHNMHDHMHNWKP
ncbi:hypothetical protein [Sulfurimonas sp.]